MKKLADIIGLQTGTKIEIKWNTMWNHGIEVYEVGNICLYDLKGVHKADETLEFLFGDSEWRPYGMAGSEFRKLEWKR